MIRIARETSLPLGLAAFAVGLGLCTAADAKLALVLTSAVLVGVVLAVRPLLVWWDLFLFGLGGALVLGYGFANVGLPGVGAAPLADALAILLLARAWITKRFRWPLSAPFVLLIVFVAIASVRLFFDLQVWGKDALRDFTLPLEVVFLPIGYWALREYGLERWRRGLAWVFVACLVYFAFFPVADRVASLGPVVGIQRAVPLLGSYAGAATAAAAGLFFFALVRPFGALSHALAAGFLAELAIFQSRGIYLAVPLAAVLVWILARSGEGSRLRVGLAATLAFAAIVAALVLPLAPKGRLGPVSPTFVAAQLATLSGKSGPGSGSYHDRIRWFHDVVAQVRAKQAGWFIGVGLGPNLLAGVARTNADIRKPHNDYLEVFARLGLPALVVFAGLLATAVGRVLGAARRASGLEARVLWWIFASAVVYLFVAATQPVLAFPYGTMPVFSLLGAGLALRDTAAAPRSAE